MIMRCLAFFALFFSYFGALVVTCLHLTLHSTVTNTCIRFGFVNEMNKFDSTIRAHSLHMNIPASGIFYHVRTFLQMMYSKHSQYHLGACLLKY